MWKRPYVVTSSGLNTVHECHRSTDMPLAKICYTSVPRVKKFLIFKIHCLSISERVLQKHRLIPRNIIFIVPSGSQKWGTMSPSHPPVARPMITC